MPWSLQLTPPAAFHLNPAELDHLFAFASHPVIFSLCLTAFALIPAVSIRPARSHQHISIQSPPPGCLWSWCCRLSVLLAASCRRTRNPRRRLEAAAWCSYTPESGCCRFSKQCGVAIVDVCCELWPSSPDSVSWYTNTCDPLLIEDGAEKPEQISFDEIFRLQCNGLQHCGFNAGMWDRLHPPPTPAGSCSFFCWSVRPQRFLQSQSRAWRLRQSLFMRHLTRSAVSTASVQSPTQISPSVLQKWLDSFLKSSTVFFSHLEKV